MNIGKKCPMCGSSDQKVRINHPGGHALISCPCGLSSRLFRSAKVALEWWHTRAGQKAEPSKVADALSSVIAQQDGEEPPGPFEPKQDQPDKDQPPEEE